MKCPKCNFDQPDQIVECLRCGVIFEKYHNRQHAASEPAAVLTAPAAEDGSNTNFAKDLIFYVNPEINPLVFWGRVLFFLIIFIWGLKFIFTPMQSGYVFKSFWHLVNLPFHEAGHIFFRPFGRFFSK